jgi:hypothetical protein
MKPLIMQLSPTCCYLISVRESRNSAATQDTQDKIINNQYYRKCIKTGNTDKLIERGWLVFLIKIVFNYMN